MDSEALAHYKEVLRLKRDDAEARNGILAIYVKKKKFDEVTALLQENVALAPNNPENHYKLGLIQEFNKDYDSAAASYKKALELKPDHAKALNASGRVLMKTGRFNEAKEMMETARKSSPDLEEPAAQLGNIPEEISPEPRVYRSRASKAHAKKKVKQERKGKKGKTSAKSKKSRIKSDDDSPKKTSKRSVAKKKSSRGDAAKKKSSRSDSVKKKSTSKNGGKSKKAKKK